MHRITRPLPALLLAVMAAAPAGAYAQANDFEGEIIMSVSMPGVMPEGMQIKYTIKGNKMRNESSMMGMQTTMIMDMDARTMIMLMPMNRAYIRMDLEEMAEELAASDAPTIKATGRKETIIGRECEYHDIEQAGQKMEVCVTSGMGFLPMPGGGSMSGAFAAQVEAYRKAFPNGYFPLRMRMSAQGMNIEMTVTEINEKSVPDSAFDMSVPDGYTEMPASMFSRGGRGGGR